LKNSGDIIKVYEFFNQYIEEIGRVAKHYKDALVKEMKINTM
jgi:hypothetical protein